MTIQNVQVSKGQLMSVAERVLIQGDLSVLNEGQRVEYYTEVCKSIGLNPLTKPFDYFNLNGKLVLYAKKDATDQLRTIHDVSVTLTEKKMEGQLYIVSAKATNKDGRADESTGVVFLGSTTGDVRANLMMKCETKAKRRVTLSICGLGMLDETEIQDITQETRDITPKKPIAPKQPIAPPAQGAIQQVGSQTVATQTVSSPDNSSTRKVTPAAQVTPFDPEEYVIKLGDFKGKKLREFDDDSLQNLYVSVKAAVDSNAHAEKPMRKANLDAAIELLRMIDRVLGSGQQ
jgi:hypothetical protein